MYDFLAPVQLQGQQPITKARMSVSLNTTTNVAWFYGGRTVMTQQPADYVSLEKRLKLLYSG